MQATTEFLEVPRSLSASISSYYSQESKLILLEGPRGYLLAHYPYHHVPDPIRHRFLVTYPNDYIPFEGVKVPQRAVADVQSLAVPIERGADTRPTVVAGDAPNLSADTGPAAGDVLLFGPTEEGASRKMPDINGIKMGRRSMEARFGDSGMAIDDGGVRLVGRVQQRAPTNKGVTSESPLFGIVPKSAVTFWAADYLPDLEKLQEIASYVTLLGSVTRAISRLINILNRNS